MVVACKWASGLRSNKEKEMPRWLIGPVASRVLRHAVTALLALLGDGLLLDGELQQALAVVADRLFALFS